MLDNVKTENDTLKAQIGSLQDQVDKLNGTAANLE